MENEIVALIAILFIIVALLVGDYGRCIGCVGLLWVALIWYLIERRK